MGYAQLSTHSNIICQEVPWKTQPRDNLGVCLGMEPMMEYVVGCTSCFSKEGVV
mgnify:CR=1 FL=1